MAKFPVDVNDEDGIVEGLNYVLSGPAGLGQNFQGYSSNVTQGTNDAAPLNPPAYLTGNFRTPYVNDNIATKTYVAPISLKQSQYLDARTVKFTFKTTQDTVPFAIGNNIEVVGASAIYDGVYNPIGVIACTTDDVTVRVTGDGKTYPDAFTGTVSYDAFGGFAFVSTGVGAKVTVNGGTDKVFISAQLNNVLTFESTSTSVFNYTVMINRRTAFPTNDKTNPDFVFGDVQTISTKSYYVAGDAPGGTIPPAAGPTSYFIGTQPLETIFTSIIDNPPVGYYWYIVVIEIDNMGGDGVITQSVLTNRSISVQVVKQ